MNSNNLKKTYFHTYESFFIENSFVVSVPFVMNWSGDVLPNYCGIWLKQQLPLRLYLGYTKTNSKTISINKIHHLDFCEYSFIETKALEYAPYFNDLNKFLQKKYAKCVEKFGGIEINILSELPRWIGLWFWSLLALGLSLIMNRLEEKIDEKSLLHMKQNNINDQIGDQYSEFYSIFSDALEFDKHIYGMISSGTKLASFFQSYYPIVSFAEDYDKSSSQTDVKSKRYFWFKLNDLYPELREIPYVPVDYGVFYSGKPVLLEQIAGNKYKNDGSISQQIKSETSSLFNFLEHLSPKQRPRFYKELIEPERDEFTHTYGKLMGIMSLRMLYFMAKVYRNGYDENSMLLLIETLKKVRQADSATKSSSNSFLKVIKTFLERFEWGAKYLSIAPNDSTIMWWSLLFMVPLEGFRKPIINVVESMAKDFPWSKLVYSNWLDGIAYEWVIIEQDLKNNIYSDFIDGRNCIVKRTNGKIIVWDCTTLIENNKQWLLLDTLNNKIYLNWEKLTSQDLHSQSATIEILKMLLENPGKDIHNKELPLSSYSKNKNDMIGKIVAPLLSLIETRIWKKLPLICKGSLYDFTIRLNNSDIEMIVLTSISS